MATRTPVRRPDPVPARCRARPAQGRAQPTLDPATARDDLANRQAVRRRRDAEELFTGQWQNRPSVLDDYKPYLDDRWSEGCTNAWKLWEGIVPLGYKGSYQRVRDCLHDKRTSPRPVTARPPSPRTVAGWILRRPDTLTESEQIQLKSVRTYGPELDALNRHVRSFATMLTERQGERLPDWLDAVRQDDLPSLHTLAAGIDRDRDAVIAGLTLPWNSGVVEGHVNRIILWNQQSQAVRLCITSR
ncbi:transposase [Streptomyces fumanus]|uniref:transposase n=1 Tax=Streptomyces fumanus TaxID=67302 RepID=UPI0033F5382D